MYVATYSNPVFLRHCLLQILHQSRRPNVLAVHENGNEKSYKHIVQDVLDSLEVKGVEVLYHHTPHSLPMPTFFCQPLQALIDTGCDYINKVDQDDILYEHHFAVQEELMFNPQLIQSDFDYAMNCNSELLVLMHDGAYRYSPKVDFGTWNPTGAHPDAIIFNRKVAQDFVGVMSKHVGVNDDKLLAEHVLPKYKGLRVKVNPSMCFVAHGKNVSVSHWSEMPPQEVL